MLGEVTFCCLKDMSLNDGDRIVCTPFELGGLDIGTRLLC